MSAPASSQTQANGGRHGELVATVVGLDRNIDSFAREAANDRLHSDLEDGGRLKRFGKRIWQGNIARDYYLQKFTRQAREHILDTGHLYAHEQVESVDEADAAMRQAVTERFVSDYENMVREGESRQELTDDGEQGALKGVIRELIARYARGELDDESFTEEKLRALQGAVANRGGADYVGSGNLFADNLLEVAQQVRARCDQDEGEAGIQSLLDNVRVVSGEANVGANTEIKKTIVDRIVEKASGRFVNETTLGTTAAVVMSAAKWGSRTVLGAAAKVLAPGVSTALVAGLRERSRFGEERQLAARDTVLGRETNGGRRRQELETALYEARSSTEITSSLRAMMAEDNPYALRDGFDRDDFEAAMSVLGDSFARVQTGDRENMDFVAFSSVAASEAERTAMLDQMNLSRALVRQWFESQPEDVRREITGDESDFDQLMNSYRGAAAHELIGDIENKDALFKKMRRSRALKAAAIGGTVGLVIGIGAQEAVAAFDGGTQGFIEQLWHHAQAGKTEHQTFLEGAFDHQSGGAHAYEAIVLAGHNQVIQAGDHIPATLKLDTELHVSHGGNGSLDIATPGGNHVNGISFNENGVMTPDSQRLLEANHFSVIDHLQTVHTHTTKEVNLSLHNYIDHHKSDFTTVTRDGWFDNNTPNNYDLNELKTWWGNGGVGVDAQGNYSFDVSHMTSDGSYHDGLSANWHQLAEQGKLKMAISFSEKTQGHAVMLNIGPDGKIHIPHDSLAARAFSTEDGHAVFHGAYAEVSEVTKVGPNGVNHIMPLSTVVGDGKLHELHDVINVPHTEIHHQYELAYHQPEALPGPDILVPPIIPVTSREGLTPWRRAERGEYNYVYGELSPEEAARLRRELSPRLRDNPDADLNPREELSDYRSRLSRSREPGYGADYVHQIDELIDTTPELREVSPDVKAIVTIPVRADGKDESAGIYDTLRLYSEQGADALSKSMLLLHVNWFDDAVNDPDAKARIDATKAAIERARADFPDLKIAIIETEWKRAEADGGIIGHVARKMTDAALLSIERAMRDGRMVDDNDVLIIRNDADPAGLSRRYLSRMIDSAAEHERTDVFTGTTRFDNRRASDLPGMVFALNFMQSLNLLASARDGNVHTAGANFGIRASTMAAVGVTGFESDYNGVASDDVALGRRIVAARKGATLGRGYDSGVRGYFVRLRQRRNRSDARGYTPPDSSPAHRRVGVRVVGAQVDTDAQRSEVAWRSGIPVVRTWSAGFDANGHAERSTGLDASNGSEDLVGNPDAVIDRIQKDMQETIRLQSDGPDAVVDSALAFVFSDLPQGVTREQAYRLTYSGGKANFTLTDIGRKHVLRRLTRDSKGRFDPFGNRKARQLYGQVKPTSKRQPLGAPMVSAA